MKYLILEKFVKDFAEEELWKIIDDYENWNKIGVDENSFLRNKAREFCLNCGISPHYHTDYTQLITLCAFRHFALKYKETMK